MQQILSCRWDVMREKLERTWAKAKLKTEGNGQISACLSIFIKFWDFFYFFSFCSSIVLYVPLKPYEPSDIINFNKIWIKLEIFQHTSITIQRQYSFFSLVTEVEEKTSILVLTTDDEADSSHNIDIDVDIKVLEKT